MHHESRHRVLVEMCEGHTHDNEAGKIAPASDVSLLEERSISLQRSIRSVSTHAAADEGKY
jgi:hypothetical protein